ncbi:neuronal acetylcholine receptor subunit alpha-7-like [Babylonia areolata]|uniref:neuronal acetylcholine receptor subunit alpha-7-like n=1 Tax=Babylonia areolata TaxID=304850 RepID=UPI003FD0E1C4
MRWPKLRWVLVTTLALAVVRLAVAQTYSQAEAVYRHVTSPSPKLRPVLNQSEVLEVFVTFNLKSISEVDEVRQKLTCNAWLNFTWTDQVRTWNRTDYAGLEHVHTALTDIWRPRVMVSNSLEDRDVFKSDISPLTLTWEGQVVWAPGTIFYTGCKMDMSIFPFDTQRCSIIFLSDSYFASEVVFVPGSEQAELGTYSVSGEWILGETYVAPRTSSSPILNLQLLTGFTVTLTLTRRPAFILLNVLLPIMVLSLLNFIVFVLPSNSGEKVTYGTTVLLSLAVYMGVVTSLLPQHSHSIPLMLVYLFCLFVLCSLVVALSILVVTLEDSVKDCQNQQKEEDQTSACKLPHNRGVIHLFLKPPVSPTGTKLQVKRQPLCTCLLRLQGRTLSMIFVGLWFLLTVGFLIGGLVWKSPLPNIVI